MPEYLEFRCCMCPNIGKLDPVCPGIDGTLHPEPSPCRFVKQYKDDLGWEYFIRYRLGGDGLKTFRHIPGAAIPRSARALPWRDNPDAAQADLNAYAKMKGWSEI